VDERDALAFGADTWCVVDQANAVCAAAVERRVEVVDGEADVVNAGSSFRDELGDRGIGGFRFEQLYERRSGHEAGDLCAIGIVEGNVDESEDVTVEGQALAQSANGDTDVVDSGASAARMGRVLHRPLSYQGVGISS